MLNHMPFHFHLIVVRLGHSTSSGVSAQKHRDPTRNHLSETSNDHSVVGAWVRPRHREGKHQRGDDPVDIGFGAVIGCLVSFTVVTLATFVILTVAATVAGYQVKGEWLEEHGNFLTAAVLILIGAAVYLGL